MDDETASRRRERRQQRKAVLVSGPDAVLVAQMDDCRQVPGERELQKAPEHFHLLGARRVFIKVVEPELSDRFQLRVAAENGEIVRFGEKLVRVVRMHAGREISGFDDLRELARPAAFEVVAAGRHQVKFLRHARIALRRNGPLPP